MPIARDEAKTNYRDHEEVLAQIMQMDAEIQQAESLLQDIHKAPPSPCDTKEPVRELSSLTDLLRCGAEEIENRRVRLSKLLVEIRCVLGLGERIKGPTITAGREGDIGASLAPARPN
jgi:hypothetical protein